MLGREGKGRESGRVDGKDERKKIIVFQIPLRYTLCLFIYKYF